MARKPDRLWRKPDESFAAVDLNAEKKRVDRNPDNAPPSAGRRPGDGRGAPRDVLDRAGMSRAMQKRIARARAEGERVARQKMAEEQAEAQRTISDLQSRLHRIEVSGKVSAEEQRYNQEMAALEAELEKAHTDGNHTRIAAIQREITEKATAWENKKRELLNAPVQQHQQQRRNQPAGPVPEGRAWIAANADWYDKPGYEAETAATIAIDERLIKEGSDPNSPAHYRKIQKELNRRFKSIDVVSPYDDADDDDDLEPKRKQRSRRDEDEDEDLDDADRDEDLDDEDQDDDDDDDDDEEREVNDRQRRRPPSMNFEDAGQRPTNGIRKRNGRIILSKIDRANMERFGMDPDNDRHVEAWARTKQELADRGED